MASSFGSFETIREIFSDAIYTVYEARRSGDPKSEYAVKLFSIQRTDLDAESAAALGPLIGDIERSCSQRISIQQQSAAHPELGRFVSPVLESGQDERGVWYATPFYPRSVNKIISGKVALSPEALEHLVRSVVQGALAIKQTCGRSHGEIQPSNIQISRSDSLTDAQVVLSDPLPGDASESQRYEKADLRAIGELIYQLVHKKKVDFAWIMLPLDPTPEWGEMFGKKNAPRWIEICSKLLDPNKPLETINLAWLDQELQPKGGGFFSKRKPKPAAPRPQPIEQPRAAPAPIAQAPEVQETEEQRPPPPGRLPHPVEEVVRVELDPAELAEISAARRKKLTLVAAVCASVVVLGAVGFFAVKWAGNRSIAAHQADLAAVGKLIEQRDFPGAREKLQKVAKPNEPEAEKLRAQIEAAIETDYQAATNAATAALRAPKPDYHEAANQAGLALRLKPGDEIATGLKSSADQGIARETQSANCDGAKGKAKNAEKAKEWAAAREAWQEAKKLCGEDKEITDGLTFASSLAEATDKLKSVQGKAQGSPEETRNAIKVCTDVLKQLEGVTDFAQNVARQPAHSKLKSEVESTLAEANKWLIALAEKGDCADAKNLARAAERAANWPSALQSWQDAQPKCKGDNEVQAGIDFAKAISKAQGNLDQADSDAKGTPTQATSAKAVCRDAFTALTALQSLASGNSSRQSAVEALNQRAKQIEGTAQAAIDMAGAKDKCNAAKTAAQRAEESNSWAAALSLWEKAKAACGDDKDIADGLRFTKVMADAATQLAQAKTKAAGTEAEAKQAVESSAQVLTQLGTVSALAGANSARQKQLDLQIADAKQIRDSVVKAATTKEEQEYRDATAALENADYEKAKQLCAKRKGVERFDLLSAKADQESKLLAGLSASLDKGEYQQILQASAPANDSFKRIQAAASALKSATDAFKTCDYSFLTSAQFLQFKETNSFKALLATASAESQQKQRLQGLLDNQKYAEIEQWFAANPVSKQCLLDLRQQASGASACAEAKRLARDAEQKNNWTGAVSLWTAAQEKCPADTAIANAVSFSKAMERGAGLLSQGNAEQAMAPAADAQKLRPADTNASNLYNLAKKAFEDADYLSASKSIVSCQYAAAVDACKKHSDNDRFTSLRTQAESLDQLGRQANDDLNQGRWEQVIALQSSCGTNDCISKLVQSATGEKAQWTPLLDLTNQASWAVLNSRLATINADLRRKEPFVALDQWLTRNNPLAVLDSQLSLYKVLFGVAKNTQKIIDPQTGKPAVEYKNEIDQGQWLSIVGTLRSSYKRLGVPFDSQETDMKAVEVAIGKH